MVQIAVEVKGKNIHCSSDESWFTNSVRTPSEFFPNSLGEVIFTAECAGFEINTHDIYEKALEVYNRLQQKEPKRTKVLLVEDCERCMIRVTLVSVD